MTARVQAGARPWRLLVFALGGAAALQALTSCSTSSEIARLPGKNISEWVMPIDSYIDPLRFETYAQNLLIQPCMESSGFVWDVPFRDLKSDNGPTLNAVDRKLFTERLASRYGYHDAPPNDPTATAWEEFGRSSSPAADARFEVCLSKADHVLRPPDRRAQLAGQLEGAAYDAALASNDVVDRAKRWRKCMRQLGVSDLPQAPYLMPSGSQASAFGLDGDGAAAESASAEEIRQATFDARCQSMTGYRRALYEDEWNRQVALLEENADELERVKIADAEYERRIVRVISDHAPAH